MTIKYKFHFEDQWFECDGDNGQSLVDISTSHDIRAPHACLEGGCGSCKGKLISGNVDFKMAEAITEEEVRAGFILACQTKVKEGPVVVDFDIEN